MRVLLPMLALLSSAPSFAVAPDSLAPSSETRDLHCQPAARRLGMLFDLELSLRKNGDELSVESARFVTKVAFSRGSPQVQAMNLESEDAGSASLKGDLLTAMVNKTNLSVDVYEGSQLAFQCK